MDPAIELVAAATSFEHWLLRETDSGTDAARAALLHITALYGAYLRLSAPPASSEARTEQDMVTSDESRRVLEAARRLPFDSYAEVFNPLPLPPEEPVIGSLADDLRDIYRDLVEGT